MTWGIFWQLLGDLLLAVLIPVVMLAACLGIAVTWNYVRLWWHVGRHR